MCPTCGSVRQGRSSANTSLTTALSAKATTIAPGTHSARHAERCRR